MTDKEKILAEIERLKAETFNKINHDKNRSMVTDVANSQRIAICEQLLHFIDSLPAKQNEDLEEASDKYANDHTGLCLENDGGLYEDFNKPKRDFIAGANWQKEQIMKSAFNGEITKFFDGNLSVKAQLQKDSKCCFGDKVKVIIIKEDE